MQGFLFIVIAVLATTLKGYFGKSTSTFTATGASAVGFSTLRMALAVAVGVAFVVMEGNLSALYLDGPTLLLGLISGIANSALVVSWLFCVRSGAFMMVDAMQTAMIILLPTTVSALWLGELPRWNDLVGIVLLIGSAVLMCAYSGKIKGKLTPSSLALLLLCGASAGTVNLCQKLFSRYCEGQRASVFNLCAYLSSAAVLLLVYLLVFLPQSKKNPPQGEKEKSSRGKMLYYALMMALCMFFNTLFATLAAGLLPAAQTYPVMQGLTAIGSVTMSTLFFRERPTLSCLVGMGMNFAALLIINLL